MLKRKQSGDIPSAAAIAEQAALWLARRDRGLTPSEQDEYIQWLTADSRHAEAFKRHALALERMMKLYEWQPGQSADPNPDLFAPRQTRRWPFLWMSLAAAAIVALCGPLWWHHVASFGDSQPPSAYLRVNERQILSDGSVVDLKDGSSISVEFSKEARRVRLTGEAYFSVAKRPASFVVVAGPVVLRAVGTAFNVRLETDAVNVLVTEGSVRIESGSTVENADVPETTLPAIARLSPQLVSGGQNAIVSLTELAETRISNVTPDEVQEALAWQAPRLQFFETPLAVAVAEFNRHNRIQLVLRDPLLAAQRVGGTFRVDNPEGFVRMLELAFEIKGDPYEGHQIILTRSR